jgi:hypothetical protein
MSDLTKDPRNQLQSLVLDAAEMDRRMLEMPLDQLSLIAKNVGTEVDHVAIYFDNLETRIGQINRIMNRLKELRDRLEDKRDNANTFLANQMAEMGVKEIPGYESAAVLREDPSVEIVGSPEFSLEFIEKYRPYIRTKVTHEFDKHALKKDLKEGCFDLPFARIKWNRKVKFAPNKRE